MQCVEGALYRFDLLRWNFGQPDKVCLLWCGMLAYSFFAVKLFDVYKQRSIDRLNFGIVYGLLIVPLLYIPFRLIRFLQLPVASAAIIACEQIRLCMKIHAYVAEMFRAIHCGNIFHDDAFSAEDRPRDNGYQYLKDDWLAAWQRMLKGKL